MSGLFTNHNSTSVFATMQDPGATADYSSLKKNKDHVRKAANNSPALNSSISMQRLDREFSPERKRGSFDQLHEQEGEDGNKTKITTEQLLKDLTVDTDDEGTNDLENE